MTATLEAPTLTVTEQIRELALAGGNSIDEITEIVFETATPESIKEFFYPVMRDEVRRIVRGVTRSLEREFEASTQTDYPSPEERDGAIERTKRALHVATVKIPGVGWIPWTDLTSDQLRARAAFYRARANKYLGACSMLEHIADLIEKAGVEKFGDLDDYDSLHQAAIAAVAEPTED